MIKALIENYKELTVVGVFAIMMAWYLWHQTRRQSKREDKHDEIQKEERSFYRNLVTNDMKELHADSVKNADLNNQNITLIKDMNKNLEKHNGHSQKAWKKTIESLGVICDRLNGGNPEMVEMKKKLKEYEKKGVIVDRREEKIPVEVERRK